MSEEQLSALLAKLKDDAGLQEKLKGAADLDAAVAIAQEDGFDVSKDDWLKRQARQVVEMSGEVELNDEELNGEELAMAVGGIEIIGSAGFQYSFKMDNDKGYMGPDGYIFREH